MTLTATSLASPSSLPPPQLINKIAFSGSNCHLCVSVFVHTVPSAEIGITSRREAARIYRESVMLTLSESSMMLFDLLILLSRNVETLFGQDEKKLYYPATVYDHVTYLKQYMK